MLPGEPRSAHVPATSQEARHVKEPRRHPKARRAVLYARVSSKEQEKEGFSIPAQLKLLRRYAVDEGFEVTQEFVDVETAKQAGRAGFGQMLSFLRKNTTCRVVLVEKTDRLYRNLRDWVTIDELGLEIHLVKENIVLSEDSRSSEKFMHGIRVLMAKNYIDNLSEEVAKGMLEKAEQGIWPTVAPLGYRNVTGADGRKTIEKDPVLAPVVGKMFEWYATGEWTLEQLTKKAVAAGMVFRKSRSPVPKATVNRILRNPIYTGDFEWNGVTYSGVHEPLVSRETFRRVQEVLDERSSKKHRFVKHDFAFAGLVSCGRCGCSFVGEIKKGRYVYYHCTGYKGKCPEPYTREERLEEEFVQVLKRLSFSDEVFSWVARALRESHTDEMRFHEEAVSRLQAEHSRIQGRIDAMYVDKLDGRIDAAFFDRKASEWRAEQGRLREAMEGHRRANRNYLDEGVRLLELARSAHVVFQRQEPREKRRLLNFVVSNCVWKDGRLEVKYRQPFDVGPAARKGVQSPL